MPRLIRDRAIVDDSWTLLRDVASIADIPEGAPVILPLGFWLAQKEPLSDGPGARGDIGIWLKPTDDPETVAGDLHRLPVIAVDFPKFSDGRGYSTARLLRDKYGFRGELRAIGDVLRDQLYYLEQCGFNAFALRADRDMADALQAFADFHDNYQATARKPVPLFRRRSPLPL